MDVGTIATIQPDPNANRRLGLAFGHRRDISTFEHINYQTWVPEVNSANLPLRLWSTLHPEADRTDLIWKINF
jgi:hypothetical protein